MAEAVLRSAQAITVACCLCLAGCWTVHARDEATIAALRQTIENAEADHRHVVRVLEATTATAQVRNEIKALHEAEMDRLKGWLWREQKKAKP